MDANEETRGELAEQLRTTGYDVRAEAGVPAGLAACATFAPSLVIAPLDLPGLSGRELVDTFRAEAALVVVAKRDAHARAIAAMRAGAAGCLSSPLDATEVGAAVGKVLAREALHREAAELRTQLRDRLRPDQLIGACPDMQRVLELVERAAPSRATVLITGESGTGKELIASTIHQRSPRAGRPFLKLHCAGMADRMLESELFGHERDPSVGARMRTDGYLALADGGTLFLDEIGEMSRAIQVELLTYLQERRFARVGGTQPLHADVRVIAATSHPLEPDVARGAFREDLFYRIDAVDIELPPLRARGDDLAALAALFLAREAVRRGKPSPTLSPAARDTLAAYAWPGNVRELACTLARAVEAASGRAIEPRDLVLAPARRAASDSPTVPGSTIAALERYAILATLESTGGSTSRAAEILGISTRTVQYRLHAYHASPRAELDTARMADAKL